MGSMAAALDDIADGSLHIIHLLTVRNPLAAVILSP